MRSFVSSIMICQPELFSNLSTKVESAREEQGAEEELEHFLRCTLNDS